MYHSPPVFILTNKRSIDKSPESAFFTVRGAASAGFSMKVGLFLYHYSMGTAPFSIK
jgi:hypothetical protein